MTMLIMTMIMTMMVMMVISAQRRKIIVINKIIQVYVS